ncbi:MAG: class I SAM-dependent methyltransferase [Methanomassiliicoccales archaeon]|jgi:ubiquinone/menaquinone biosynthesis C-methylase UbiE|nr:class I SAM-dependent methyltransferase [Methanomassiliicoccales archaeon]
MRPRDSKLAAWDRKYQGEHPRWRGPSDLSIDILEGETVLELGCGDGKTLRALVRGDHRTIGLDFSRKALLSLMKRGGEVGKAHLVQADCISLPFPSLSLHHVVAHHVLEHLEAEERRTAATEVVRVLRPGGRLHVSVFAKEDLREGKGELVEPSTYAREGILYHYFLEEELEGLFDALSLISMRTESTARMFAGKPIRRSVIHGVFRKGL